MPSWPAWPARAWPQRGPSVLVWTGWQKVVIGLAFSSVLGFVGGGSVMLAIYWLWRQATPGKVRQVFRWLQIASAAFMAFSHGSNDGQKFMGALTLALVLAGGPPHRLVCSVWR